MSTGICLSIINRLCNADGVPGPGFDVKFKKTLLLAGVQSAGPKDVPSSIDDSKAPNNAGIFMSRADSSDVSGLIAYAIPGGSILVMYFNPMMIRLKVFAEEEILKDDFVQRAQQGMARVTASFAVDGDTYLYEFQGTSEPIKSGSGKAILAIVTLCNIAVTPGSPTVNTNATIGQGLSQPTQPTQPTTSFPYVAFCATCKRNMLLLPAAPNPSYLNSPWRLEKLQETLEAYLAMFEDPPLVPPISGEVPNESDEPKNQPHEGHEDHNTADEPYSGIFEPIFRSEPLPIFRQHPIYVEPIHAPIEISPSPPPNKLSTAALTLDNQLSTSVLPNPLFDFTVLPPCTRPGTSAMFPPDDVPSMSSRYNNAGLFSGLPDSFVSGAVGYAMPGGKQTFVVSFGRYGFKMLVVDQLEAVTAEAIEQVERDGREKVDGEFEVGGVDYRYTASLTPEMQESGDAWSIQCYVTFQRC